MLDFQLKSVRIRQIKPAFSQELFKRFSSPLADEQVKVDQEEHSMERN